MTHKTLTQKELKVKLDKLPKEEDINTICFECGKKRYGRTPGLCTIYEEICDLCHQKKTCTEVRDFRRGELIK